MWKDFKEFAIRGNALDMAIGIIIGTAFGKIISTLVNNIIMPPIGMLLGKVDFSDLAIVLHQKTATTEPVVISYGLFINSIIDFLIVAFAMFIVVKQINRLNRTRPEPIKKDCPYCFSNIPIKATRCPNCTSELK